MEKRFKALGDRTRLEILLLIALNPDICLCHIEECFQLSSSNLSRHLKELESVELVTANKVGKWKHYQISGLGLELVNLIKRTDSEDLYHQISVKSAILNKELRC
jgi:ArsR family transcriptional regulator